MNIGDMQKDKRFFYTDGKSVFYNVHNRPLFMNYIIHYNHNRNFVKKNRLIFTDMLNIILAFCRNPTYRCIYKMEKEHQ